jgi:hypothetical protein
MHNRQIKVPAPFTMAVNYLPEFRKQKYAEQEKRNFDFVFRCDNVAKDYLVKGQKHFDTSKDALLEKFWDIVHRCKEIQVFDNRKPKLQNRLLYVVDGIVIERFGKRVYLKVDQAKRKLVNIENNKPGVI